MNSNGDDKKLDWMYKGANSLVDREEYLLGRSVDKTLEQLNAEEKEKKLGLVPPKNHVEHECIPPSIRDFNKIVQAEQVDISAKLQEDPLVAIKKREEEARRQFLQNPVQLKKLQEALKAQQLKKKKKNRKKGKSSDSDSDLDNKIVKKLKYLKEYPSELISSKRLKKKSKDEILDTILMHKFNQLKDRLSQDDLNEILVGDTSESDKETKKTKKKKKTKRLNMNSNSESESDINESRRKERRRNRSSSREKPRKLKKRSSSNDSSQNVERHSNYRKINKADTRQLGNNSEKAEKKYSRSKLPTDDRNTRSSRSVDKDYYKNNSNKDSSKEKTRGSCQNETRPEQKNIRKESSMESGKNERLRKDQINADDSGSDLESKILKKLRMLRDSVKSKEGQSDNEDNKKQKEKSSCQSKSKYSSSDSSTNDDKSDTDIIPKPSRYYDSDEEVRKPKAFGLVKSDGTKLTLNKTYDIKRYEKSTIKDDSVSKPIKKNVKKLSEEEKEKLRREMMTNAEQRDQERSDNLRKYREEDKREEKESGKYNKNFLHKELLKTTKDATVETRIKSNLNNIQRSSKHMDSHFSRRK